MIRPFSALCIAATLCLSLAGAAQAQNGEPSGGSFMDQAAAKVRTYIASIPNMPRDILVIPAAGDTLWPGTAPSDNIRAEIWIVVPKDNPKARPLMMFAVRPGTGEVYAMFLTNLQRNPRYQ